VVEAPGLHGRRRHTPQEHQRREFDRRLPLALDEVHQHGHGKRGQTEEKQRG